MTQIKIYHAKVDQDYYRGGYSYFGVEYAEYRANNFLQKYKDNIIVKNISNQLSGKDFCICIEYIVEEE